MADAGLQRPWVPGFTRHIALGLLIVALFYGHHRISGYINEGNGEGWDGTDYSRMLQHGWASGTVITQNRPIVVWAAWPMFKATGDPVKAFDVMNFLYVFILATLLSALMERYGAPPIARIVGLVCIFLSIPFKLFAFYPVLVDLGACLATAIAIWLILYGPRWGAVVACIAAVLARELGPAVVLFGIHRDWRRGTRWWVIALTYLPAAIAFVLLRLAVARIWAGREDGITVDFFYRNIHLILDPFFLGLFAYFVITLAGGVSAVAVAQPRRWWAFIREEPEWVSFLLPILGASVLVGMDTLRYLTSLLPAIAVFYARCARDWSARERVLMPLAVAGLTFWSQRPFQVMNTTRYFADWFPYYIWVRQYPRDNPPMLWPVWGWRFIVLTAALVILLALMRRDDDRVAAH